MGQVHHIFKFVLKIFQDRSSLFLLIGACIAHLRRVKLRPDNPCRLGPIGIDRRNWPRSLAQNRPIAMYHPTHSLLAKLVDLVIHRVELVLAQLVLQADHLFPLTLDVADGGLFTFGSLLHLLMAAVAASGDLSAIY